LGEHFDTRSPPPSSITVRMPNRDFGNGIKACLFSIT
jgi:hypothetical protein